MATNKPNSKQPDFEFSKGGAHLYTEPSGRTMRYYPVAKVELEAISAFNGLTTFFFSMAGIAVTCLLGFGWDLAISGPVSSGSKTAAATLIFISVLALGASVTFGCVFLNKKKSKIREILESAEATPRD